MLGVDSCVFLIFTTPAHFDEHMNSAGSERPKKVAENETVAPFVSRAASRAYEPSATACYERYDTTQARSRPVYCRPYFDFCLGLSGNIHTCSIPSTSDDYGLHRGGGVKRLSRAVPVSMSVTASPHCPPPPLLHLRLKSWQPLSSLSLASSLAEAVLPDRALYLPTFGHFLIVNKTSLSLSPSLFLSLPLMPWHPLSIYDARRRNCPIH